MLTESHIQCTPSDRDWDADQQKCDRCSSRRLDCGPNILAKDDPTANSSYDKEDSNESANSSSTQQHTVQSLHKDYVIQDDQLMKTASHEGGKGK